MVHGELFVMMAGLLLTHKLFADSLISQLLVYMLLFHIK